MIIADDFGLGRGHNSVILRLLNDGVINGTSVFVDALENEEDFLTLSRIRLEKKIQVGLHFNLTERFTPYKAQGNILSVWCKSIFWGFKKGFVESELHRQFELFQELLGFAPDFIDGHQHCHAIPGFWPALHRLIERQDEQFWVRSPCPATLPSALSQIRSGGMKSILVMWWGWRLRYRLGTCHVNTNSDFSGLVKYSDKSTFETRFRQLAKDTPCNCLFMTHPGSAQDSAEIVGHTNYFRAVEATVLAKL